MTNNKGQYQGSYPFLKIAREYCVPYAFVLAVGEWIRDGRPAPLFLPMRYREQIERYLTTTQFGVRFELQITWAQIHFRQQQQGLRDMEGVWCPERNGSQ